MNKLPQLLDARGIAEELGVPRSTAWAIMRHIPTVHPEGLRKVYARRVDVHEYLERCTVRDGKLA